MAYYFVVSRDFHLCVLILVVIYRHCVAIFYRIQFSQNNEKTFEV